MRVKIQITHLVDLYTKISQYFQLPTLSNLTLQSQTSKMRSLLFLGKSIKLNMAE
jgi:hypothetical protein